MVIDEKTCAYCQFWTRRLWPFSDGECSHRIIKSKEAFEDDCCDFWKGKDACLFCQNYNPDEVADEPYPGVCDITGRSVIKSEDACKDFVRLPDPVKVWSRGKDKAKER